MCTGLGLSDLLAVRRTSRFFRAVGSEDALWQARLADLWRERSYVAQTWRALQVRRPGCVCAPPAPLSVSSGVSTHAGCTCRQRAMRLLPTAALAVHVGSVGSHLMSYMSCRRGTFASNGQLVRWVQCVGTGVCDSTRFPSVLRTAENNEFPSRATSTDSYWFGAHTRHGCLWIHTGKGKSALRSLFTPTGDIHDTPRLVPSPCRCLTN